MSSESSEKPSVGYDKFTDNCAYEDRFVKVNRGSVTLKWFYFPTAQNKQIDTNAIRGVYYEPQNMSAQFCKVKTWGMSFTPCWWACDARRNWHSSSDGLSYMNACIDCGEKTYKGFTICDIKAFLDALRKQLHPDTVVNAELPF